MVRNFDVSDAIIVQTGDMVLLARPEHHSVLCKQKRAAIMIAAAAECVRRGREELLGSTRLHTLIFQVYFGGHVSLFPTCI